MKRIKFCCLLLTLTTTVHLQGCKKDAVPIDSTILEGRWQLIGQNMGLPEGYVNIKNGELFLLNSDSTFSKGTGKCHRGEYSISGKYITLEYSCESKDAMLSGGIQKWHYRLDNGILQISPTFLNCDEGCHSSYKKIANN